MKTVFRLLAITLLAVAIVGCHPATDNSAHAPAFQLKLYHVPADQSRAIANNLASVLESSEFLVGTKAHTEMRATQPFPGTVLVLAPASVQPSIANAIAGLTKASGKQSGGPELVPLRVQSWVIQAKAGAGDDSAALKPLASALDHVRSSLGPSHFVLADSATLSLDAPSHDDVTKGNGMLITSRGHKFIFRAVAAGTADVALNLQLSTTVATPDPSFPQLDTTVAMRPGEYVVLAEAPSTEAATHAADATLMNLLVARVDRMTPAAH